MPLCFLYVAHLAKLWACPHNFETSMFKVVLAHLRDAKFWATVTAQLLQTLNGTNYQLRMVL